jgi:septal ring factor EnvC (AmiA/AmiB activator)
LAGELVADGGIFLFSRHLQTMSEAEFAGLNKQAADAHNEAGTAHKEADSFKRNIAEANERAAEAEERAAKAEEQQAARQATTVSTTAAASPPCDFPISATKYGAP